MEIESAKKEIRNSQKCWNEENEIASWGGKG